MIKATLKKWLIIFLITLSPTLSLAAVPSWTIVPDQSKLNFTVTQNGAPVSGEFKKFTGVIVFDPTQLSASHIVIVVDMNSVFDSYQKISDTLKTADFFDVSLFPQATFKSTQIIKTGDDTYQAIGTLSLRDKNLALTLNFSQQEYSATHAKMIGSTTISRTAFGVGQGQWADTDTIKDAVQVNFIINATRMNP